MGKGDYLQVNIYQAGSFKESDCQHIGHSLLLCDLRKKQVMLEATNHDDP